MTVVLMSSRVCAVKYARPFTASSKHYRAVTAALGLGRGQGSMTNDGCFMVTEPGLLQAAVGRVSELH